MKAKRRFRIDRSRLPAKGPPPGEQPDWRPITGYRTDLPLPKIKKHWVPMPSHRGVRRTKQRVHKFLMNMPMTDFDQLRIISDQLMIPVSVIIRLSVRRFLRQFRKHEVALDDGTVMRRMTTRRLFSRAEREVLDHYERPAKLTRSWLRRIEDEELALLKEQKVTPELISEVKRVAALKAERAVNGAGLVDTPRRPAHLTNPDKVENLRQYRDHPELLNQLPKDKRPAAVTAKRLMIRPTTPPVRRREEE